MPIKKVILFFLLPIVLTVILHWKVFALDVCGMHVWRQSQTQTVIYNFSFGNTNILHPLRFDLHDGTREVLYEFPVYQYSIALINKVFGYSVVNTRVFSFTCFILFLLGFFRLQRNFFSEAHALTMNALLCFSPLLYYYCVVPLPDIMGLAFAIWFLYFIFSFLDNYKTSSFLLACICLSIAVLVKLPFALFGSTLIPIFLASRKKFASPKIFKFILILVFSMVLPALWYYRAMPTWHSNGIVRGIFDNQSTLLSWLDALLFNLVSSFPELLANYGSFIFLVVGIYFFFREKRWNSLNRKIFSFLFVSFFLFMLFELNMMGKTHDYYLMPFIIPVFMVISFGLSKFKSARAHKFVWLMLIAVPVIAFFRMQHRWTDEEAGFNLAFRDESEAVQKFVPKDALCIVDSDESRYIALYYFKRVGFSLQPNDFNEDLLQNLSAKGGHYLISTSKNINEKSFTKVTLRKLWQKNLAIYYVE